MSNGHFFIGIDLGQAADFTALSIIERDGEAFNLRHLYRFPLKTSYVDIVKRIGGMLQTDELRDNATPIVDATGVGSPVIDMMRNAGIHPVSITITGGDSVNKEAGDNYRVPKRDIVSTLQVLFQTGQLKVADKLSLAPVFIQELINFKVTINVKTAHDSYEAWREGVHDDLVLSVGLAAWYAKEVGCFDPSGIVGVRRYDFTSLRF